MQENYNADNNPVVWGGLQEHQCPRSDGVSPALTAAMGMGGGQTPIFTEAQENVVDMYNQKMRKDKCTGTILANGNTGQFNCGTYGVLERSDSVGKVGQISSEGSQCGSVFSDDGSMATLTAGTHGNGNPHIYSKYRIRKLTPLECWRLMGFSDEDFHKAELENSNTQLYKQAGNSIVENVLVAIFGQMIPGKENVYKELGNKNYNKETEGDNYWMLNWLDEFMVGHKGFICGGCFKNIFNREKVKDLDIFFECKDDFDEAVEYFDSQTPGYEGDIIRDEAYSFLYENKNVKAYKHIKTGIRIELCCKIFGKPEDVLKNFDFTIVKFAYYKEEVPDEKETDPWNEEDSELVAEVGGTETHIEYRILMDDKFFEHLHMKRLVIDDEIPFPMSTFERMFRYAKYGFFPCKETKMKIILALRELTDEQVELSESLYDGMD